MFYRLIRTIAHYFLLNLINNPRPRLAIKANATPGATKLMTRPELFNKLQDELKNISVINADMRNNKIESQNDSEDYREPLSIDLHKEIKILLSTGGPADGFKLNYYKDELQGGVYFWQDWGTYDEAELTPDQAQTVEDFYLYGDPSTYLQDNNN